MIYPRLLTWFDMLVFFKVKSYGISGQIFGFISSFLSNRLFQVVLDGKSSQKYPVNAGVPEGFILDSTLFLLYINYLPDNILSVIRHLICGNNLNCLLNLNLICETLWTRVRSGLLISMLGKLSCFHMTGIIIMVLLM